MSSHVSDEIASQPECWRWAGDLAARSQDQLPRRGERVAVVGCGTSWFVAQAYAALREAQGEGETDAFAGSEFPASRSYDHVVVITRSGTTTEVLHVLAASRARTSTVITAVHGSPAAALADHTIVLDFADELSVVQTRSATSFLTLLRASLGVDVEALARDGEEALALDLRDPEDLAGFSQLTFLGRGWTTGLAHEAALKTREAAQAWAESYPAMDYRHGPIAIAEAGRATWALGEVPDGLAADVGATGATFVHHGSLDPQAQLVVVQRVAVTMASRRGLDPDRPRHLTRSVVLDPPS